MEYNCISLRINEIAENNSYADSLFNEYKRVFLNSLISSFALDKLLFNDKLGGNIQTLHNANKKIYANKIFEERSERTYNRDDYAPNTLMNSIRKEEFKKSGDLISGYTNKVIPKDGRSHLEHIVSVKECYDNFEFRLFSSKEDMKNIITSKENTTFIEGSLNVSKRDSSLNKWGNKQNKKDKSKTNAQYYDVDLKKASMLDKNSRIFINQQVAKNKFKYYSKSITSESLKSGGKMAIRQAIGIIFTEVTFVVMEELPMLFHKSKNNFNIKSIFKEIISLIKKAFSNVKNKMKDIIDAINDGFQSGVISTIITTILNTFTTTASSIIKTIRSATSSLCEACKILIFNKDKLNKKDKLKAVLKVLSTGIGVIIGTTVSEIVKTKLTPLKLSFPILSDVINEVIPMFIGSFITGLLSVTAIYWIDTKNIFEKIFNFEQKLLRSSIDITLEKFNDIDMALNKYMKYLFTIDLDAMEKEIIDLSNLNDNLENNTSDELFNYCNNKNINLGYENNSIDSFKSMLLSKKIN